MGARKNNITVKQAAFVKAYLSNGHNAAAAYRHAYKSQATPRNAAKDGERLLRNPRISPIIAQADQRAIAATDKVVEDYAISRESLVRELAILAYHKPDYISAAEKRNAAVDLLKMNGDYVEKQDVTHHSSYDGMSDDELRERIASRARRDAADDGRAGKAGLRKVSG